jgi:hypothetical protein
MARNKLTDLNDHLFVQLERLNDEELTGDQVELEVKRAQAISGIASQVIKSAQVTLTALKLAGSGDLNRSELPETFGLIDKK